MFYTIQEGHGLPRDPFKALVAPRPIGWISTRSKDGQDNLAPYSFFNAVSDDPHIVMFSSAGEKDSAAFARQAGCFVAHSVSAKMFDAMNQSSATYPRGTSEIEAMGLAVRDARCVGASVLVDAPSALECVVTQIVEPAALEGEKSNYIMVFGQVVAVHIHDNYLTDEGRFDAEKAQLMARGGYLDYALIDKVEAKPRPKPV